MPLVDLLDRLWRYHGEVVSDSDGVKEEDKEEKEDSQFKFVVEGVLLTTISVVGLLGNAVAIAVLSRPPGKRGSFSTLLLGLSSFDTVYLLVGLAIFGLPDISTYYRRTVFPTIITTCFGLGHIARVGSVYVTMSVTVERYFAIVHPLRHFWQKKYLLAGSTLAAILYNVPKFFELESKFDKETRLYEISGTALRVNPNYVTYYIFWSKFILVEVIPYVVIILLNSLIIKKIRGSWQFRRKFVVETLTTTNTLNSQPEGRSSDCQRNQEANLTSVLVCISFLFVSCQSIKIVPDLYEAIFCRMMETVADGEECQTTPLVERLISVSHLMLAINSSTNFVVYIFRGEKFRETLTFRPDRRTRECVIISSNEFEGKRKSNNSGNNSGSSSSQVDRRREERNRHFRSSEKLETFV